MVEVFFSETDLDAVKRHNRATAVDSLEVGSVLIFRAQEDKRGVGHSPSPLKVDHEDVEFLLALKGVADSSLQTLLKMSHNLVLGTARREAVIQTGGRRTGQHIRQLHQYRLVGWYGLDV